MTTEELDWYNSMLINIAGPHFNGIAYDSDQTTAWENSQQALKDCKQQQLLDALSSSDYFTRDDAIDVNCYYQKIITNSELFDSHGTHVAGIIGAAFDDQGIRGVANNVELMSLVAIGSDFYTVAMLEGSSSGRPSVEAIDFARKENAKIINASYGMYSNNRSCENFLDQSEYDAIKAFPGLFVAAAGNDQSDLRSNYHIPASYAFNAPGCWDALPNIIVVAASSKDGGRAVFSNYGLVDVYAPGEDIYSSVVNGGYESWNGTSMATPIVSGIAALIWGIDPSITPVEVKEIIIKTGNFGDSWWNWIYPQTAKDGKGRNVNAFKAVYEVIDQQKKTQSCPVNLAGAN
jgi:subtilisin family serine protease